ncbi:MAG: hypothetical protein IJ794_13615 [Lachnospiraceae bacterium]|nr:hypothetical protein [Lachnospiraceae bacterium]
MKTYYDRIRKGYAALIAIGVLLVAVPVFVMLLLVEEPTGSGVMLAGLSVVVGIGILLTAARGNGVRQIRQKIEAWGVHENVVGNDLLRGLEVGSCTVGKEYMITTTDGNGRLFKLEELLMAYAYVVERYRNGVTSYEYRLHIVDRSGEAVTISHAQKGDTDAVQQAILQRIPYVLTKRDDALEYSCKKYPEEIVRFMEARKQAYLAKQPMPERPVLPGNGQGMQSADTVVLDGLGASAALIAPEAYEKTMQWYRIICMSFVLSLILLLFSIGGSLYLRGAFGDRTPEGMEILEVKVANCFMARDSAANVIYPIRYNTYAYYSGDNQRIIGEETQHEAGEILQVYEYRGKLYANPKAAAGEVTGSAVAILRSAVVVLILVVLALGVSMLVLGVQTAQMRKQKERKQT